MIDPFTIISALGYWATGQKVGGLLAGWANGKNITHFQKGCQYFSEGVDSHDTDLLDKAVSEFDYVDEDEDRLFVVAFSYYLRAICYAYLLKFSLSYRFLNMLEAIEYDFFTRKKDTIEEVKKEGRELKPKVKQLEREYNEYLQSQRHQQSLDAPTTGTAWKTVAIILSVILGTAILAAIGYFFFMG